MKPTSFIPAALIALPVLLTHCGGGDYPPPPDYTPFGDGLKAIGICLVAFAVVQVLGSLANGDKN